MGDFAVVDVAVPGAAGDADDGRRGLGTDRNCRLSVFVYKTPKGLNDIV